MNFSKKTLTEILSYAWDESYNSVPKDEVVKEVLVKYNIKEEDDAPLPPMPLESEERIYSIKELLDMALPAIFIHKDCGKCHIEDYEHGRKMVFEDEDEKFEAAGIKHDGYPFDVPMKQIYE